MYGAGEIWDFLKNILGVITLYEDTGYKKSRETNEKEKNECLVRKNVCYHITV